MFRFETEEERLDAVIRGDAENWYFVPDDDMEEYDLSFLDDWPDEDAEVFLDELFSDCPDFPLIKREDPVDDFFEKKKKEANSCDYCEPRDIPEEFISWPNVLDVNERHRYLRRLYALRDCEHTPMVIYPGAVYALIEEQDCEPIICKIKIEYGTENLLITEVRSDEVPALALDYFCNYIGTDDHEFAPITEYTGLGGYLDKIQD